MTKTAGSKTRAKTNGMLAVAAAAATAAAIAGRPTTAGATTYVWNNAAAAWELPADFTPTGTPTATDVASFDPTVASAIGTVMNPTINSPLDAVGTLNLADTFLGGTYNLSGTGTLTIGNASNVSMGTIAGVSFNVPTGIVVRGFGTQTISGPTLAGSQALGLTISVGTDAGLTLTGTTTATNVGAVTVSGGTLTLDNSASTAARLNGTAGSPVLLTSSGTLSVLGNAAGTAIALGNLSGGANVVSGLDVVSLTPNGGPVKVTFGNGGTAGTLFSLRPGTRGAYQFAATSGVLGDPAGAQVAFVGTPNIGVAGLLGSTNSVTSATVGFATVKDSLGVNFATFNATNGIVSVASVYAPAIAVPTPSTIAPTAGATTNAQFNPTGAVTTAANASGATIRITPTSAGGSLALTGTTATTNTLATNALMLDGSFDFAISGTGIFGVGGTRYVYVNNPTTTLSISEVVDSGANPTVFAGPGVVALTGTALQNTNTDTSRFSLAGGVVRANNTQVNFAFNTSSTPDVNGVISFGGGVLEITGGANGTGAAADFTRGLGTTAGSVTWGTGSGAESGSGGFSAFGAPASVNIGGASASLAWNTSSFVPDGNALKFGSLLANAVLTFQNPIALDAGTAGLPYTAREVNVTGGVGGDKTILSGVISGSSQSDLIKTGTGTLVLSPAETYAGRTIVEAGTLAVTTSLAGPVIVARGGTITVGTGNGSTGAGSVSNASTGAQTWVGGGAYLDKVASTVQSATSNDLLVMSGLTVSASAATPFAVAVGVANSASGVQTLGGGATLVLADDKDPSLATNPFGTTLSPVTLSELTLTTPGVTAAPGFSLSLSTQADTTGNGGYDLILSTVAAPEPTSLLLLTAAVGPLALGRRRRAAV